MIDLSLPQLAQRVSVLEAKSASPLNWRGAYDAKLIYNPNDVVTFSGSTYVCIKYNFNQAPTVPAYWLLIPGTASGGFVNPMTAPGDLIVGGASGVPGRMAKGAPNTLLGVDGASNIGYIPMQNWVVNPMTTLGDLIQGAPAGAPIRLAKGANNSSLHIDSFGVMNWQPSIRHAGQWTQTTNVHPPSVTSSAGQELDCQTQVMPFTITSPNSALLFYSQGSAQINYQFGGEDSTIVNTYLRGDGLYTWLWMTSTFQPTAANVNYFVSLSSVALFDAAQLGGVGAHYAQVRMVLSSGNMTVYLRPQSTPYEQFQMGCLEFIP